MTNYWHDLSSVWQEMEQLYALEEFHPEQEADIQAYLYYGLLTRLKKEGLTPIDFRTEETFEAGRVDLNVNDRLFIEIKLLSRKGTYTKRSAWKKRLRSLTRDARKLRDYVKETKSYSPKAKVRQPIVAVWNWKADPTTGLDEDLHRKLERFRRRMRRRGIRVLYGPKPVG